MSLESKLCLFSKKLRVNNLTIDRLLSFLNPTPPIWVTKYPVPMREWENHFVKRNYDWFPEPEFCRKEVESHLIAGYFHPKKYLRVDFSSDQITQNVAHAVREQIDPALHNGWIPMNSTFGFGIHDIYEELENEEGHLFGHVTFSYRISAYGHPSEYNEFRHRLFALPTIKEVQKQMELVTGPLEHCFYSVE